MSAGIRNVTVSSGGSREGHRGHVPVLFSIND